MNYNILNELGRGGMATVYLAEHKLLKNKVAIKILNEEFIRNKNIRNRFLSEARNLAAMSHPNIIKVTDLIEEGDTVAFVMEHIDGETLKEFLNRKGKLTDDEIRNIFSQMLEALGYVHEQDLIHRDIKPSNFMIDKKGKVKLLDFGIAKNTDTSSAEYTQTGTGMQMGTPMYMSPEQVKNTKEVTFQSDIYSLGVVLWQMVMGKKPYNGDTLSTFEIQLKIFQEPLILTNSDWDLVIQKATEKNSLKRFKDCEDFKNSFENESQNSGNEKTVFYGSSFQSASPSHSSAENSNQIKTFTDEFGLEFILVESGTFMMGAQPNDLLAYADEKPLHQTKIEQSFYLGKYPITQVQWHNIMGNNPSRFSGCSNCPVESVSFHDIQKFLSVLNQRSSRKYRLPSEEEWEYAAKGAGQSLNYKYAGSNNLDEVAWFDTKSFRKTNPVGTKKPNELGFFDMSGNVMEWCDTIYKSYDITKDEMDNGDILTYVIRGGSWNNHPIACRISNRFNKLPDYKQNTLGFRLVLVP